VAGGRVGEVRDDDIGSWADAKRRDGKMASGDARGRGDCVTRSSSHATRGSNSATRGPGVRWPLLSAFSTETRTSGPNLGSASRSLRLATRGALAGAIARHSMNGWSWALTGSNASFYGSSRVDGNVQGRR
jgi:hypothetical protein